MALDNFESHIKKIVSEHEHPIDASGIWDQIAPVVNRRPSAPHWWILCVIATALIAAGAAFVLLSRDEKLRSSNPAHPAPMEHQSEPSTAQPIHANTDYNRSTSMNREEEESAAIASYSRDASISEVRQVVSISNEKSEKIRPSAASEYPHLSESPGKNTTIASHLDGSISSSRKVTLDADADHVFNDKRFENAQPAWSSITPSGLNLMGNESSYTSLVRNMKIVPRIATIPSQIEYESSMEPIHVTTPLRILVVEANDHRWHASIGASFGRGKGDPIFGGLKQVPVLPNDANQVANIEVIVPREVEEWTYDLRIKYHASQSLFIQSGIQYIVYRMNEQIIQQEPPFSAYWPLYDRSYNSQSSMLSVPIEIGHTWSMSRFNLGLYTGAMVRVAIDRKGLPAVNQLDMAYNDNNLTVGMTGGLMMGYNINDRLAVNLLAELNYHPRIHVFDGLSYDQYISRRVGLQCNYKL